MRTRTAVLLLLLSLTAGACGDEGTAPEGDDTLTSAEVEGLVEALVSVGSTGPDLPATTSDSGPAAAAETITFPVDDTVPCELGGTLVLEGDVTVTVDDETGSGSYQHEISQVYAACRVRSERISQVFVLDGAPAIVSRMQADIEDGAVVTFTGSEEGAVRWRLGDRSGSCPVDMTYELAGVQTPNPTIRVTGTICGRTVSEEFEAES